MRPALDLGEIVFKAINWLAVLVATAASIVLGFTWYDVLFADLWKQLDPRAAGPAVLDANLIGGVLTGLVIVVGMAWVFARTGVASVGQGLMTAFMVCLAFDTTVYSGNVFFSHAPAPAQLFYAAFDMICFLTVGLILAAMRPKTAG